MKAEKVWDALTELDDDLIDGARDYDNTHQNKSRKVLKRSALVLAACLAVFVLLTAGGLFKAGSPLAHASTLVSPTLPKNGVRTGSVTIAETFRSFMADAMLTLLSEAGEENSVMSPVSLFTACAMLAEITDTETRQEILDVLAARDIKDLRTQAKAVWELCYKESERSKSLIGNSLWLSKDISYKQTALDVLGRDYYASVFYGDMTSEKYSAMLRKWINDQTGGLLKEQAGELAFDPLTVIGLVNTLYFEAAWYKPFLPSNNRQMVFHAPSGDRETEFLHGEVEVDYYQSTTFIAARKEDSLGYVWFFLPKEGVELFDMMQDPAFGDFLAYRFEAENYGTDVWNGKEKTYRGVTGGHAVINFFVPKLDITKKIELIPALRKLGIESCFDPNRADFSAVTGAEGLYVSKADQTTRLILNEEGVKAASFTNFTIDAAGIFAEDHFDLVLDRPFFLLVTGEENLPLFAAVVNEP